MSTSGVLFVICVPTQNEEYNEGIRRSEILDETPKKAGDFKLCPHTLPLQNTNTNGNIIVELTNDEEMVAVDQGHNLDDPTTALLTQKNPDNDKTPGKHVHITEPINISENPNEKENLQNKKENIYNFELSLGNNATMKEIIRELLCRGKIENAVWTESDCKRKWQIIFSIEDGPRSENVMRILNMWGIGAREGSSVTIVPCTLYTNTSGVDENEVKSDGDEGAETGWERFVSSISARLNVGQVVENVKKSANITFDFVMLVIVAAILAAFGLAEDSTIFLAASMLISPLMGPILAGTFGTAIKDRNLQRLGVVNELIGLGIAAMVGFVFGLIMCCIDERYGIGEGVTKEMLSRCELHSLLVGIMIALPSGAAVAISILSDNIGSLVGVAISASLLPPAVNAGLLWALACVYQIFEDDTQKYNFIVKTAYYSEHQSVELAIFGSISMCLTIVNIICIFTMGVVILKIKEVAPLSRQDHPTFWKDIKIARDYNKTHQDQDMRKTITDEIAGFEAKDTDHGNRIRAEILRRVSHGFSNQNTWSPMNTYHQHLYQDLNRPTIHDIESLYNNSIYHTHIDRHHQPRYSIFNHSLSPLHILKNNMVSPEHRRQSMPTEAANNLKEKALKAGASLRKNRHHGECDHPRHGLSKITEDTSTKLLSESGGSDMKQEKSTKNKFTIVPVNDVPKDDLKN